MTAEHFDYKTECMKAMQDLSKDSRTIFLGQTVEYDGSPMFKSMSLVPPEQKYEMPVAEEMQMGISIGLSLLNFVPVSIYPRIDFLICAINQLVNHLDKCEEMSKGQFKPKVIIRTQIGNTKPLYPGIQHCGDYTEGLRKMCKNIKIVKITRAKDVRKEYSKALKRNKSTILIEKPTGGWKK